jgi:2-amino-4-hydroxy-6-hydroxymethyldihydropteridine diphosphokinase
MNFVLAKILLFICVFSFTPLKEICKIPGLKLINSSSVYETDPWGKENQDDFLNSVIEIETDLSAENLLKELKHIEKMSGRINNSRWSEREIDIDLLFYGNEVLVNETINVPHRQIENRKFVLIPLAEIAPEFIHPVFKKTISELLEHTTDKLNVVRYQTSKV